MPSTLRVVSFGLGPIGQAVARLVLGKRTLQLVGAIDADPAKAGKDLAELLGLEAPTGLVVEADALLALQRLQPDVVLHCTSSHLPAVKEQLLTAIQAGVDVVSSTEELLLPDLQHPALARELDEAARAAGVSVLGTGVNPGFAMDLFAVVASAATADVRSVKCTRIVDAATRRLPLQKKIGAGLTKGEFQKQLDAGKVGHVGMRESVGLVARALDLGVDRIEQTVEPVLAAEDHKTPFLTVKEGQVAGLRNHGHGYAGKQLVVHLDLSMYVGAPDPRDEIQLEATPPIHVKVVGGIPGDEATAAILVNSVHGLAAAPPGLRSVLDTPVARLCR